MDILVGFSRTRGGVLGKLIRFFTGGLVNHAFLLYPDPLTGGWMTLGANENGLTNIPLDVFTQSRIIVDLFKPVVGSLDAGVRALHLKIGISYDFSGLLGMVGVELARRLGFKDPRNWLDDPHRLFCSEYVSQVILKSSVNAPDLKSRISQANPNTIDPALLDTWLQMEKAFVRVSSL